MEPSHSARETRPQSPVVFQHNAVTPSTPKSGRPLAQRLPSSPYIHRERSDSEYFYSDVSRAGSIYSLSRVSFAGQIAQLTSIKLPDATSLAKRISSIPTASEAARALSDASDQIRLWIRKAFEVLQGLNANDDVEWAAAGGRDGIVEVDQGINRFEKLVDVYVSSIERLQTRDDAATLSADDLTGSVKQMESIIASWAKIKSTLKVVKTQVQLAIDWEALWNTDLGEVAQELGGLSRHIFEMEEKRHHGVEHLFASTDSFDLNELESILEEQPKNALPTTTTVESPFPELASFIGNEEAYLLGLSARMQPLRTSLDFLPIKLASFRDRANAYFPTACQELEDRKDELEEQWRRIEDDAKALRSELGEDKWITVFRNAGQQASKMCDSIERTLTKLKTALDSNEQVLNRSSLTRKMESYEAKKLHYAPAVERVLSIIDRGVKDRLTINGDILRNQSVMRRRWVGLQSSMKVMDGLLRDLNIEKRDKNLRDSVSTVMSSERSLFSSLLDTPGSSPASSVMGASRKDSFHGSKTPTQAGLPSTATPSTAGRTSGRKLSTSLPRRSGLFARNSMADLRSSPSPSPVSTAQWPSRPLIKDESRPKWNASTKADKRDFAPLSKFEPSPYAKKSLAPEAQPRSAASRVVSTPVRARAPINDNARLARKASAPALVPQDRQATSALAHRATSRLSTAATPSGSRSRLSAMLVPANQGNEGDVASAVGRTPVRPASSLDKSGRRSSLIPTRGRVDVDQATNAGAERPKWR